jgi:hypothetical protein
MVDGMYVASAARSFSADEMRALIAVRSEEDSRAASTAETRALNEEISAADGMDEMLLSTDNTRAAMALTVSERAKALIGTLYCPEMTPGGQVVDEIVPV